MEITTVVEALSDHQLVESISRLVVKEREVIYRVLVHLIEIENRRLHVKRGYSSLFDYCVRGLQYSGSAAHRRIKAARALKRFPQIGTRLRDGRLSLNALGAVEDLLTEENLDELLDEAQGKSRDELLLIVARHKPVSASMRRESIVPVYIKAGTPSVQENEPNLFDQPKEVERCGTEVTQEEKSTELRNDLPQVEQIYKITFAASPEFKEKLDHARLLSSQTGGSCGIEEVLLKALDSYIDRHCPKKRLERREKRKARIAEKVAEAALDTHTAPTPSEQEPMGEARSRHIPAPLRDQVLARDGFRCTYVSPEGIACESTHGLEIDHIVPFAKGGAHTPDNLQTVCRAHNQLYANECFGEAYIKQKIAGSRKKAQVPASLSQAQTIDPVAVTKTAHIPPSDHATASQICRQP